MAQCISPDIVFCIRKKDELALLLDALDKFRKCIVETPRVVYERTMERRKNLRELGYAKYLRNAKIQSFPFGWLRIEDNGMLGLSKAPVNYKETKRISELLGMKPLHFSEQPDRIHVIIGRKRWISAENLKKTEETTKKKVFLIRKGEEEGVLTGLYNSNRKFLGVGTLYEIDYVRKTIKIMTPVASDIAIAMVGKVKLDKNCKEVPTFGEMDQTELAGFSKLF
jgi:polynucleotide 5'-kinase involved in rRNA processing